MLNKLIISIVIFLACFGFYSFSQPSGSDKITSLLVAEFDPQAAKNSLQHLVLYKFSGGKMTGKEKILAVPAKKEDVTYVRFDLGVNRVYRNRYVVTGIGNVIDIQTKKVMLDAHDQFVKFSGDSIVFYTNDIFKGKYYSVFDLLTSTYKRVETASFKAIPGQDIEVDYSSRNFRIWLYPVSATKELLVKDAGYGEEMTVPSQKTQVPFLWIDNTTFVYANYSADHTSAGIWKINANKTAEKIGDIDGLQSSQTNSKFFLDEENNIVYSCARGDFLVDIKKKKVSEISFQSFKNGFHVETEENQKYGRIIRYNEVEIGRYHFNSSSVKTSPDGIAFQFDLVVNGEHFVQGVAIWSCSTKKWIEMNNGDVANIIGWTEN